MLLLVIYMVDEMTNLFDDKANENSMLSKPISAIRHIHACINQWLASHCCLVWAAGAIFLLVLFLIQLRRYYFAHMVN